MIMLVTGGCRSGKSAYAQAAAEGLPGERLYVATCPAIDDELAQRIALHREARRGRGWETVEEPLDLAGALRRRAQCGVVLVDCISLWINNLLYEADRAGRSLGEAEVAEACEEVIQSSAPGTAQ